MNASPSRMPTLARAAAPVPRFNPFADAVRPTLYDLIDHSVGGDAADKLVEDFGGRRLYVPAAPAPSDQIARSIGLLGAFAMARVFGGERILVPSTSSHNRRRVRIIAMRANHVSISRIAHELRCTERYVYKVLAVNRAPETPAVRSVAPTSAPIAERLKRGPINQR